MFCYRKAIICNNVSDSANGSCFPFHCFWFFSFHRSLHYHLDWHIEMTFHYAYALHDKIYWQQWMNWYKNHDVSCDECLKVPKHFEGVYCVLFVWFGIRLKHFDLCLHFNTLSLIHWIVVGFSSMQFSHHLFVRWHCLLSSSESDINISG